MTPRLRRIVLIVASIVFLLLSTLVVGLAAGWNLSGGQLIRQSGLYIDSEPRARLIVDGAPAGTTPYRTARLAPGRHTIRLEVAGYYEWEKDIEVTRGKAISIGQVPLMPMVTPERLWSLKRHETALADACNGALWIIASADQDRFEVRPLGVATFLDSVSLPFRPTTACLSQDSQRTYFADAERASVLTRDGVRWDVPVLEAPVWAAGRTTMLYGLQKSRLVRIDVFSRVSETLVAAQTLHVVGEYIWYTEESDGKTLVWRAETTGAFRPKKIFERPEHWQFMSTTSARIVLQNPDTTESLTIAGNPTIGYRLRPAGFVTTIISDVSSSPMVWTSGISHLFQDGDPVRLIDRLPQPAYWAGWYLPKRAVALAHAQEIRLYYRIGRSGFMFLRSIPMPKDVVWLASTSRDEGFYYRSGDSIWLWSWGL